MSEVHDSIAAEIILMSEADQMLRNRPRDEVSDDEWVGNFHRVDVEHTARMKAIITQIGWPTVSKVGGHASYMAWLLVQHADNDHEFQRACLYLMQLAYSLDPADVREMCLHYLEDRVLVAEGRPQKYGTQILGDPR